MAIDFILRLVELLVKFDRAHFQRVAPLFQREMLRHLRQIRRIKPPFRDLRRNLLREAARKQITQRLKRAIFLNSEGIRP